MSLRRRLARLEQRTSKTGTSTSVLITDADGADFLASHEGEDYNGDDDDLVITTGIFTNHKFTGRLTDDDEAAIAKLREAYDTVIIHEVDGYHLRLCHQAYIAALEREGEAFTDR